MYESISISLIGGMTKNNSGITVSKQLFCKNFLEVPFTDCLRGLIPGSLRFFCADLSSRGRRKTFLYHLRFKTHYFAPAFSQILVSITAEISS